MCCSFRCWFIHSPILCREAPHLHAHSLMAGAPDPRLDSWGVEWNSRGMPVGACLLLLMLALSS